MAEVAQRLQGPVSRVAVVSALHPAAAPDEERDGIRHMRRGGRLTVYL